MGPEAAALFAVATWADRSTVWEAKHYVIWATVIFTGFELLGYLVDVVPPMASSKRIKPRGRFLESFGFSDWAFIFYSRVISVVFVQQLLYFCRESRHVLWAWEDMTILNTVGSFFAFFVVYDFFYTLFHMALHHRSVYAMIHKHHHKQMVPTRGNKDAVNVHPFEFTVGEYLHMVAVYFVPCHFAAVAAFIIIGGFMASLNHTRFDVGIPFFYDVKNHDQHHVIPNTNYAQYIMLWDHVFGSYAPYPITTDKQTASEKSK